MPDNDYGRCADCDTQAQANRLYVVTAPVGAREPRRFMLCAACWERMVGAAMLSFLRGL